VWLSWQIVPTTRNPRAKQITYTSKRMTVDKINDSNMYICDRKITLCNAVGNKYNEMALCNMTSV